MKNTNEYIACAAVWYKEIPIKKEMYQPMLKELEENGVVFKEKLN